MLFAIPSGTRASRRPWTGPPSTSPVVLPAPSRGPKACERYMDLWLFYLLCCVCVVFGAVLVLCVVLVLCACIFVTWICGPGLRGSLEAEKLPAGVEGRLSRGFVGLCVSVRLASLARSSYWSHLPRSLRVHLTGRICRRVAAMARAGWRCPIHKIMFTLLDVRVSSLRRGHGYIICIVPIAMRCPIHKVAAPTWKGHAIYPRGFFHGFKTFLEVVFRNSASTKPQSPAPRRTARGVITRSHGSRDVSGRRSASGSFARRKKGPSGKRALL